MTDANNRIQQEALDWVIRLRHADAADWMAFDAWLGADSAHADAYWPLAAADADVAAALVQPLPFAEVIALEPVRKRRGLATALLPLAASVTLAVGLWWTLAPGSRPHVDTVFETGAGETREASLPDGTRVALNGDTRLILEGTDPRQVRLERGEARFAVVHRADAPFVVSVGTAQLQDIGTVFNVVRDGGAVRVAVAEGAVQYREDATSLRLDPGDSLTRAANGTIRTARIAPADVAAWRARRLTYDQAPLELVATDLARATGVPVTLDPGLAGRHFSGGFHLGTPPEAVIARAAILMGVRARRDGAGWKLSER